MTKEEFIKYVFDSNGIRLTDDQFSGKEKIVNLLLVSLTSIPEGFDPVVGGILNLNSLTSISEGFSPVVGGKLLLGSLTEIPENWNPINVDDIYIVEEVDDDSIYIIVDDDNIKPILNFMNFNIT